MTTVYELKDVVNNSCEATLYASFNGARTAYIELLRGKACEGMLKPKAEASSDTDSFNSAVGAYGIVIKERRVI